MFGFFEDEEQEPLDEQTQEFEDIARQISAQAPDSVTGLTALRDLYSESEFKNKEQATQIFSSYSNDVRKRFGETKAFDTETTMGLAPVEMVDIKPESTDPEKAKLETINKWEEENLKALAETEDPRYIQARSQLERGIKQTAALQRRDFYGKDNYIVTDAAVRFGQGAIGPVADAIGADSVSDFFTENSNPDNDDSYWGAVSSGVGSGAGAVLAGAATTATTGSPWGTAAYLGLSGAGSVRKQVEGSLENEGTAGEALAAGGIESVSQLAQVATGSKVFGSVAQKVGGKVTSQLGARIFPRIIGNGLLEGTTEAGGQVLSNVAENIGQGKDDSLLKGVGQAGVAGFIVGGVAHGVGELAERGHRGETPETDNAVSSTSETAIPETEATDLKRTIEQVEGAPPVPREAVPAPRKTVELDTEATPVMQLSDNTEIVEAGGKLHLRAGDKTLQSYDSVKYVSPETAELLRAVTNGHAPDGTAVTITTDEDGNLLLNSDFLNEDLTVATDKTGVSRRVIPTSENVEGSVPVFVDKPRTEGRNLHGAFVAGGQVNKVNDGALSAAKVGFGGQKESQFLKKLRQTYGEEELIKRDLLAPTFSQDADGNVTSTGNVSLYTYFPQSNVEQADVASKFINENGVLGSLAHLQGLDRFNRDDAGIASVLDFRLQDAMFKAEQAKDYDNLQSLTELQSQVLIQKGRIAGTEGGGGILQTYTETAQNKIGGRTVGDVQILKINQDLRRQATEELQQETGQEVSLPAFSKEVEVADQTVAAIEKEIKDPVEIEIANIDAEVQRIGDDQTDAAINQPIKKYTEEINTLKNQIEEESTNVRNQLTEADAAIKDEIDNTSKQISEVESEITERTGTSLEPTKAQVVKDKQLDERLDNLTERKGRLEKEANTPAPGKDASKTKVEAHSNKVAKAKEELAQVESKIAETAAQKEEVKKEIEARTSTKLSASPEQTRKLDVLKSKLDKLNTQFKNVKTQDPKKSNTVSKLRSLTAQRKLAIRELKKQKNTPRELTSRQKQLVKKREELSLASKEGRIRVNPDLTKKLIEAKNKQVAARTKLTKAEQKIQEKLAKFSAKDQQNLREWYNLLNDMPEGTPKRKVQQAIFNVESKYLPPNSAIKIDNIFNFWRRNILSGPITQVRNIVSNATNAASVLSATAVTGVPRGSVDFLAYAGGWVRGISDGRAEMAEILAGNQSGRMTIGMDGEFTPTKLNLLNPLGAITEMMQRFMSVADSAFYRGAESGQAYLVEYIAAEKQKVPLGQRRAWVEDRLYNTTAKLAKISAEVDGYAQTLKAAGIKMSPRERQLAIFERAQSMRDEVTRAISARHGEKSVFLQEPEGYLGALARGISASAKDKDTAINIGGKDVYPLKHVFPFVRTVANVSNVFLDHSPLGLRGAKRSKNKALQLGGKDVKTKAGHTISNALEARQLAGQAMIGSALMGGLFSIAMAYKDDEDPFIEFYGNVPRGKYQEWQEKGIIPYSVKVGNTSISLQNTPLALVAAVIGGGMQGVKNGGDVGTISANIALASMGAVADLSFIKSVGDMFNMFTGAKGDSYTKGSSVGTKTLQNAAKDQAAGFLSGFIPASGFLKNIGKWMDDSPTETYNNFSAKMLGQLPAARALGVGQPQLNMFGEPITKSLWDRTGMGTFLASETTDPTLLWLQESGHRITDTAPVLKLEKEDVTRYGSLQESRTGGYRDILDEEQSREVLELSGPRIKAYLEQVRRDPNYKSASERSQNKINEQVSRFRAEAKLRVLSGR